MHQLDSATLLSRISEIVAQSPKPAKFQLGLVTVLVSILAGSHSAIAGGEYQNGKATNQPILVSPTPTAPTAPTAPTVPTAPTTPIKIPGTHLILRPPSIPTGSGDSTTPNTPTPQTVPSGSGDK